MRKKMKWNGGQLINVSTFCKSWVAAKKVLMTRKERTSGVQELQKIGPNISAPANFRLSNSIWRTFLKKFGNRCLGLKSRFLRNTKKKFQENYLNHSMYLMIKHLMMILRLEFKEFSFHSKLLRLAFLVTAYNHILLMETYISARLEASAK